MRDDSASGGDKVSLDDVPWHTFGLRLPAASTAKEAVCAAKLDWSVVVGQGVTEIGPRRPLIREDLREMGADAKIADVGPDYRPMQNIDLFTFFDPIVKAGVAAYDSIGALENGKWVWMIARMKAQMEIAPEDSVAQFILLAFKHGTSGPPTLVCKPVRLAGKSTLRDELLYPLIRVKVTPGGWTELEDPPQAAIGKIARHFDSLADRFRAMLRVKMDEKQVHSYLETVFPAARASGRSKYSGPVARERAIKECTRLFVEGKGNDLPSVRRTLWAAYSAIAEYVDYYETRLDDPQRLHQIWGSPIKSYAMSKATKLVR
jgi:hypothetical protein